MKSSLFSLFLTHLILFSSFSLFSHPSIPEDEEAKKKYFESFRNKKESEIPFLVITANYQSCAILAAIARQEKGIPCILLPAAGDKKGKIWFIPARNSGIIAIAEKDLGKFLSFLAPGRIVILGDELIVPEKCRPLPTSDRPVTALLSNSWHYNALVLGNLFSIEDMQKMYTEAMENNITEPFSKGLYAPPPKKEEVKKEEPKKDAPANEAKKQDVKKVESKKDAPANETKKEEVKQKENIPEKTPEKPAPEAAKVKTEKVETSAEKTAAEKK